VTARRWTVRPPEHEDFDAWRRLYAGYADFYETTHTPADVERVWGWIHDPAHPVECLLLEGGGRVVGLAHVRAFPRPLSASTGGFLDDLYVDPGVRGTGAVDALMAALRDLGTKRGWTVLRWITAEDNYRARRAYDRLADRTSWVTYDMPVDAP
jgi:ribosomal protein S18 acetylase RimI-like enzyme